MKKFKDTRVGDKVWYFKEFGKPISSTIIQRTERGNWVDIELDNYDGYVIGEPIPNAKFCIHGNCCSSILGVATTISALKEYWYNQMNRRLEDARKKISNLEEYVNSVICDIDKLNQISDEE